MGKILETKIDTFSGGMTPDNRDSDLTKSQLIKHFDFFTKSHSLTPYRDTESAHSSQSTDQIQNFLIYNTMLYGLGITGFTSGTPGSPGAYAKVFETSLTGIANPTWAASTNGSDSSGGINPELFVEYKGVIYGAAANNRIWAYNIGTTTFTQTALTIPSSGSFTNLCQGLVHSKDDVLYLAYDNVIVKKDNGAGATVTTGWTSSALTLPSNLVVTSLCEYGNYLAIGCRPLYDGAVNSKVFLWDRDSSLTTLSESIDWGNKNLYILENINGYLVGVSVYRGISAYDGVTPPSKIVFSRYGGGGEIVFNELLISALGAGTGASYYQVRHKQKANNRLYFGVGATSIGGSTGDYSGIWSVGASNSFFENSPLSVSFDRVPNNNTLAHSIVAFKLVNEYMFISYMLANFTTYAMSKTNDATSYTANSTFETKIFNLGDSDVTKKLIGATLMFEPLPSAGSVVLGYKKDSETSFTTIFTHTTDNSISHGAINIESTGATLPEFKEIQFQIISTGGAVITGLKFKTEIIDKTLY